MRVTLEPPNIPEADVLMPRRRWVRWFGLTWAALIALALVVAALDSMAR